MSYLERHLEQIALSAESIATLPFPPPKIFTNALLSESDITSLIRDTEAHECALFSVPPSPPATRATNPNPSTSSRRQTIFNVAHGEVVAAHPGSRVPRRNTAVAAVLGTELHTAVRKAEGEVDVEVLLRGVEKLNAVYPVSGVEKRVAALRRRYEHILGGVRHYELKVERQTRELEKMNKGDGSSDFKDEEKKVLGGGSLDVTDGVEITDEELMREEDEIRELERRKKQLEESISSMERDLGGLLR